MRPPYYPRYMTNSPVKISKNSLNLELINEGGRNRCTVVLLTGSFSGIALRHSVAPVLLPRVFPKQVGSSAGKMRSVSRDERTVVFYDDFFNWKKGDLG